MGTEIDRLEVQVEMQVTKANAGLDKLVDGLSRVADSLTSINGSGLTGLANGVQKFAQASAGLSNVKTTDFTRLANNIRSISSLNTSQMYGTASAMGTIAKAINSMGAVSTSSVQIADMAKNIAKLGGVNVQRAITNLPQLEKALSNFIATMSKAPAVSKNVIQMTNSLAELASQGNKVGAVANTMSNAMNTQVKSTERATKSNKGLTSALGSLYQKYFWLSRGIQKAWGSVESSMDFLETVNYFEVAMRQIGDSAASAWKENGYASAEAYAESFAERAKQLTAKMTGYEIDENGNASYTGMKNLGMDPDAVLNYQAVFAQVSSSIGVAEESALNFSKALTMLGADWASLRNLTFEQSWEKFASALAGQSRAVRSLGIDITNATLQEYAYKYGLGQTVSEMNQATKAQLRLLAILDQSKVAFGDLANTIDSPANQLRMFEQNIENLARTIGNLFLPIISKVLPYINGLVIALQRLFSWMTNLLGIEFDSINSSIGGISDNMEDLIGGADDYTESLDEASKAANRLKNNLQTWHEINNITVQEETSGGKDNGCTVGGGVPVLDSAIIDALGEYESAWNKAFENMQNKAMEFADKLWKIFEPIREIIEDFAIGDFFQAGKDTSALVSGIFNFVADAIDKVDWYGIGQKIGDFLAGIDWIKVLSSFVNMLWQGIKGAIELVAGIFSEAPIETALLSMLVMPKALKAITASKYVVGLKKLATGFAKTAVALTGNKEATKYLVDAYPKLGKAVNVSRRAFENFRFGLENGNLFTGINEGVSTVRDNLTGFQKGLIGIVSVAGEFVLLQDAFYDLASGSDNVVESLLKIVGGAGAASAALYVAFGPAGLVVAAITGVAAAIMGIKRAFDDIRTEEIGISIKNAMSNPGGVPLSEVTSQFAEAITGIGDSFTIITEKSAGLEQADIHIRDTWLEIEKIETAMDAGVLSVDEGTVELTRLFGELAATASDKFTLLENTLLVAFGENGVLSGVYERLGISTENTTATILQINDKVEKRIEELTKQLATMDPSNPNYATYKEELASLMSQTDELTEAMSNYELALSQIDYSDLMMDDGSLNTEKLQEFLDEIAAATETANTDITNAIASVKTSLQDELDAALAVDDLESAAELEILIRGIDDSLTLLKSDVALKATELTDAVQIDFIQGLNGVIENAKTEWGEKGFWEQAWNGVFGAGTEDEYVKEEVDQQVENINELSSAIDTALGDLKVDGAGWASEAMSEIYGEMFDTKIYDAGVAGSLPMMVTTLSKDYKGIIEKTVKDSKTIAKTGGAQLGYWQGEGFRNAVKETEIDASNITTSAYDSMFEDGEFGSPSKKTYQLGQWWDDGFNLGISENTDSTITTIEKYINRVISAFSNIVEQMISIGSQAMQGFNMGMDGMSGEIFKKVQDTADSVSETVKTALDIHSPSRVMFGLGKYTTEGFIDGIQSMFPKVEANMGDFTRVTEGLYSFDMNTHKPQVTSFSDQYYEIMQSDVGMEENNMLLRELLSAVKMGKTIEIDGRPVFEVVKRHNREEARANRFHMLMSD